MSWVSEQTKHSEAALASILDFLSLRPEWIESTSEGVDDDAEQEVEEDEVDDDEA